MKTIVDTGLPEFGRPTEHAVIADKRLYTVSVPLKIDGTFETGEPKAQIALALDNLEKTMQAAGGTLTDILQAIVFLTSADYVTALNEEWTKRFSKPYPNRGILIVGAIGTPGIIILIQAHAYVGQ